MKLYSLFCIVPILASPNGVPVCEINNQISGMGPASELGYTIVPTKKDDGWTFTVANPSRSDFQGILLYVTSSSNAKTHVGKFTIDNQKFKYQNSDLCKRNAVNGALESTVVHSNPSRVPFTNTFQWTATADELNLPDLTVKAVIAASPPNVNGGLAKWQYVPDVLLPVVSSNTTGTFVVFHIACDTYIALYLSHVVQQDTMKPRDSQLAVDEKKLQTYALQLKRNLNFIFFCDIIGFGLYFIGILLPNNSPSGYALTESIQIIAGLQLCFKPILYGWIFMSMLVMKFSIDLRIKETVQKVKK
ncbi:hypothetical protein HDV02_002510 [Globomyces sp. JEL0801]|nr:hypothetical protein HDV02_002510 [Globomyces sp. JEL0801]